MAQLVSTFNPQMNITNQLGLQCPGNCDNRMMLQFIDPQKFGVIMGPNTMGAMSLAGFFDVVSRYSTNTMSLMPGETQRVQLGNIGTTGPRRDIRQVDMTTYLIDDQQITVTMGPIGQEHTLYFQSSSDFNTFITNFKAAIATSSCLTKSTELINIIPQNNTFQVALISWGIEMTWYMQLGEPQPNGVTIWIPALQLQTPIRYPNGRCRFIFIMPNYNDLIGNVINPGFGTTSTGGIPTAIPTSCNLGGGSGIGGGLQIPGSNQKHLEYAFDDDYMAQGPANATWRRMGKLFVLSSDADVTESDENLIETIWIRNPQNFTVAMQVLIAT